MTLLFWFAVVFLAYTFAGYPFLLWVVSLCRKQQHQRRNIQPAISLIIPAHNEARRLMAKLQNTMQLLYPKDKLEIIVASDASEDETAEIVRSFGALGVKLVELPERRGKHYAQMIARDISQGDILVFTDASVLLEPQGLQTLVSNFADPGIGCVSSVDYISRSERKGLGEQFYVLLEMGLRSLEARAGSMISVSGSLFAARREVCDIWHPQQSSDFFIPLHTVAHGLRVVMDPECQAHYSVVASTSLELQRKVRTIVHGLEVVFTHPQMLNPWRYGFFSWQLVSHKLFRWLVPFGMLSLLVSSAFLWKHGTFYQLALLLQVVIYGSALLALISNRLTRFNPLRLAGFFLLGNAATLIAWAKFFSGEKFVAWNPTRR